MHGTSLAIAVPVPVSPTTTVGVGVGLYLPDQYLARVRLAPITEPRFVLLGLSRPGRLLVVVHTERGHTIRLLSARQAARKERHSYEEIS